MYLKSILKHWGIDLGIIPLPENYYVGTIPEPIDLHYKILHTSGHFQAHFTSHLQPDFTSECLHIDVNDM